MYKVCFDLFRASSLIEKLWRKCQMTETILVKAQSKMFFASYYRRVLKSLNLIWDRVNAKIFYCAKML